MHIPGDTAENRGSALPSMRRVSFTIALSEPSRRGLVFWGGVRVRHAHIQSAEPFEAFSATNCSAADLPLRRLEHHAINAVQY